MGMCSRCLRSSISHLEFCGFSLLKKRYNSIMLLTFFQLCIIFSTGEGKSSGEGSCCNGEVSKWKS